MPAILNKQSFNIAFKSCCTKNFYNPFISMHPKWKNSQGQFQTCISTWGRGIKIKDILTGPIMVSFPSRIPHKSNFCCKKLPFIKHLARYSLKTLLFLPLFLTNGALDATLHSRGCGIVMSPTLQEQTR